MDASVSTGKTGRFARPEQWLRPLEPGVAADLIAAASDLALFLDADGVIRDLAVGGDLMSSEDVRSWIGRPWAGLVTPESRDKVTRMLDDAANGRVARWREINLPVPDGPDIPLRFLAIKLGSSGIVALGRDLRGLGKLQQKLVDLQRSMDRQYHRSRNAETRYRLLFQMSSEAVLIVDAGTRKVSEANAAAAALLGIPVARIVGKPIEDLFQRSSAAALDAVTAAARTVGRSDRVSLQPASDAPGVSATFSAFRQEAGTHLLVRLADDSGRAVDDTTRGVDGRVLDIVKGLPEAFVVVDLDRRIVDANDSFLQLVELATLEQARGQRLDRWVGRPGVDVELIVSNLREHGSLRDFATIVHGQYDGLEEVEITAVSAPDGQLPCYGFLIRTLPQRSTIMLPRETELSRSVSNMTDLVGRVALKDLVRETTDLVEQMCIEAALNLTGDNRASAAQILGLSRQGLYAKLRRYGMGDLDGEADAADS